MCWPTDATIAAIVGLSARTVSSCLRDLAESGRIDITHARGRRRITFPSHPHAKLASAPKSACRMGDLGKDRIG